jgi:drug/metabolite transporter (DMT)-like permease
LTHPKPWQADLAIAAVAFLWGATFVVIKNALGDTSVALFLAIRFSIATVALLAVFKLMGQIKEMPDRAAWTGGLLAGICLFGGYLLQTWGLRETTPAKAGFLTGLYVPLVPLLGALVYRTRPRALEFSGVLLAFLGMGLLTVPAGGWSQLVRLEGIGRGDLLVTACAIPYAGQILVLDRFSRKVHGPWLAILQVAVCGALAASSFWWIETPFVRWTPALVFALGVTAIFATAIAFAVQTWAQRYTTPTHAAIVFSLEPVFAWLVSFAVAGEVLTTRATIGAALILAGILLVEMKPGSPAQHPSDQTGTSSGVGTL